MKYLSVVDLHKRWVYTKTGIYKLIKRNDFPPPFAVVSKGRVKIYKEEDIISYEEKKPWLFDDKKKKNRQKLFFLLVNSKT